MSPQESGPKAPPIPQADEACAGTALRREDRLSTARIACGVCPAAVSAFTPGTPDTSKRDVRRAPLFQ